MHKTMQYISLFSPTTHLKQAQTHIFFSFLQKMKYVALVYLWYDMN